MALARRRSLVAASPMRLEVQPGDLAWRHADPFLEAVWPPEVMAALSWRDVVFAHADRRVLVWDGDNLVCHVGIYGRDGVWNGRPVRIGGIGGVATRADRRRQGHAGAAMREAAASMTEMERADFGLLFCEPHNFAFYRGLGWHPFQGMVLVDQPQGREAFTVMTAFVLDLKLSPHQGSIDLCGLPW